MQGAARESERRIKEFSSADWDCSLFRDRYVSACGVGRSAPKMMHDAGGLLLIPYRYQTGIGVPLLLALLGVIGKKLVRQTRGWKARDFYLGVELTLAAVSSALLNIFDLLNPDRKGTDNHRVLLSNFVVTVLGMLLFMFVLSLHRDWESNNQHPKKEAFWLLGVSNAIGFGLLVAGIILIP